MPSNCVFALDHPTLIYYSGETINGRITLTTASEKTVKGIYIIFAGAAKVHWEEQRVSESDHFQGHETFLNKQTCVFGDGVLMPGIHEYTFCIPLPMQCPTSVIEKYGKISYEISLKLNRPFGFDNVFTQLLTVIKQLDLNCNPEYLLPIRGEDIKYFCWWPCFSDPITSTLSLPFGGWAPGQEISYKLEIDNRSPGYDLYGTQLKLQQIYTFTASSPCHKSRTHENTLSKLEQSDRTVLRLTKRTFEGKLRIPAVPPSSVDSGGIIQVHYRIKMNIKTGDFHTDSEICIPITIGTTPLVQSSTNPNNVTVIPATGPTPDTPDHLDGLHKLDAFNNNVSPAFEEATHIGEKFQDTDKDDVNQKRTRGWVPKYPMYNNFAMPTAASAPQTDVNVHRDVVEFHPPLHIHRFQCKRFGTKCSTM